MVKPLRRLFEVCISVFIPPHLLLSISSIKSMISFSSHCQSLSLFLRLYCTPTLSTNSLLARSYNIFDWLKQCSKKLLSITLHYIYDPPGGSSYSQLLD